MHSLRSESAFPRSKDNRKRLVPRFSQHFVAIPSLRCHSHHQYASTQNTYHIKEQIQKRNSSNLRCYHSSMPQYFATEINNSENYSPSQPEKLPPISPEQRKAADLELERMKLSTEHVMSTLSEYKNNSPDHDRNHAGKELPNAFINELSVAFNYWISKWLLHYHPYLTVSPTNVLPTLKPRTSRTFNIENGNDANLGLKVVDDSLYSDYGTNQALRILKCLLETGDLNLIRKILFAKEGNAPLISLIESMLLPCTTNFTQRKVNDAFRPAYTNNVDDDDQKQANVEISSNNINEGGKFANSTTASREPNNDYVHFSSNTALHNIQPSIWKSCIIDAFHLIDVMHHLQQKCNVEPDTSCFNVKLFTWSKLATLLHVLRYQDESGGLNKNTPGTAWKDSSDVADILAYHGLFKGQDKDDLNLILDASLQIQSVHEVVQNMEDVLTIMEQEGSKVKPDLDSYNFVLAAITKSDAIDAPYRAEWYLKRMERTEDEDMNTHVRGSGDTNDDTRLSRTFAVADTSTYNLVFNVFASAMTSKNHKMIDDEVRKRAMEADAILQRMEARHDRIRREELRPDVLSYSTVLSCYANAGMAREAEDILNKMIHLSNNQSNHSNDEGSVRPNIICFNTVIDAWSKTRGFDSADRAYSILTQMENLAEIDEDLYPDTITYSTSISAFARSGRDDAGDRAEELLQRSLHLYKHEGRTRLKPDSITFISVLDALSKQSLRVFNKRGNLAECHEIEQRMKNILKQMDELDTNVRPCTVSHNLLLDLYAKTLQSDKAEQHLREHMVESYQNGNTNVKPDIISYNSLLLALSRSPQQGSLQKAEQLLKSMENGTLPDGIDVQPDIISYNSVMSGSKRDVNRSSIFMVHDLLLHMEDRYKNGLSTVKPNIITYNILLDAWSKSQHPDTINQVNVLLEKMIESDDVQPDVFSFSSVISTLASSGKKDAVEQAQSIIQRMHELNIKPNRITYNSLINCWSKSRRRDSAEKAEEILIKMTEMNDPESSPDAITFSSVINCWAQSGEDGCGERAQAILDMMESNWKAGNKNMKPNKFTYGSVLNAFAKGGDEVSLDKAMSLLERMEKTYLEGNDEARPNEPGYNTGKLSVFIQCIFYSMLPSYPLQHGLIHILCMFLIHSYFWICKEFLTNKSNRGTSHPQQNVGSLLQR